MPLNGCATPEGTARYRERFRHAADDYFRLQQNLSLSSIGIGTYLGDANEETDKRYTEAVARAVELGANVIDTAANYRFQRSERSIGAALGELAERGFAREEVVICTKGGYLPFDGAPPRDVRKYIEENFVAPGIATFADIAGGAHCMTPRYLENQLEQSLRNMKLDCVDVYYVHNPESQLGAVSAAEFQQRLRAAFKFLEQGVASGKIKNYGVATWNGFRVEPDSPGYHSLEQMIETAREAGGKDHHFGFIQLPLNLAMPEALFFPLGSLATDAQTGIQFVRSAPGITTALVGMSSVAHVEENLQLLRLASAQPDDLIRVFDQE
jgi:aryl-alcohol dehydrogenase-like predicted oxidoreductase